MRVRTAGSVFGMLGAGLSLATLLALAIGSAPIAAGDLWLGITHPSDPQLEWVRLILVDVRLPRVLVAAMVGAALATSGAALQSVFRNPLADPSVLGVSAGGALCAQAVIFLGLARSAPWCIPLAACAGALLATLCLLVLIERVRFGALESLILGGVALGQIAVAMSSLLVSMALRDFTVARRLLHWMMGTLDARSWMHVAWGLPCLLLGAGWLLLRARDLDALLLGEATAPGLGVDVPRLRRQVIAAAALLSGGSVAIGGVVAFVGLVVPHLLRPVIGASNLLLLPACLVAGASFVIIADLLARTLIAPEELQLGVITAAIGAPWFVLLLHRRFSEVAR